MIKIFFLIRSLNVGGTERQLVELVKGLDKTRFHITVGLFYDQGALREEIKGIEGVNLLSLDKKGRWDLAGFGFRLARVLRELRPDILYSLLPEANIAGLIEGRMLRIPRIVWGLRASNMDTSRYNWLSGVSIRLCAWLSRFPDLIIVNSHSGRAYHVEIGYKSSRMTVIPNGIDTERFMPNRAAGLKLRSEWNINEKAVVIGLAARLDPMKDHKTFLKAAEIIKQRLQNVYFVCIGSGAESYAVELRALAESMGITENVLWLGERSDMPDVYNAFDIATSSSSFGEGFSNAIGEAMACGIPCVATDVGDSALIVGDTGIVTPIRDAQALAEGWMTIIRGLKDNSGYSAHMVRERIVSNFSSGKAVHSTASLFSGLK